MDYWFNISTKEVEEHDDPKRARSDQLLGPYGSREEAEKALEKAEQRTREWDEDDEEWDAPSTSWDGRADDA